MRRPRIGSIAAVITAGVMTVALSITAAGASPSASVAAKAAPPCAGKTKKAAIKAITLTWDVFLNGGAGRTLDARAKVVQGSEDPALFKVFTDTFAANADVAATTSAKVNSVKCTGKKTADVAYDLVLAGVPSPGIAPPATAVLEGKIWKVSKTTVCDLVSLVNPAVLESGPCAA
jgi:hypothetical protein